MGTEQLFLGRCLLYKQLEVVAFDLDGTLIDSKPSIVYGIQQLMEGLGMEAPSGAAVRQLIGMPLPDIFQALNLPGLDYEDLRQRYNIHMYEHMRTHLRAFQGVSDGLQTLKELGLKLALITSRGSDSVVPCLTMSKIDPGLFSLMIAREDTTEHKPSPMPLLLAQEKLACSASRMLYVGDAHVDVASAKGAGSPVIYVTYDSDHVLEGHYADYVAARADTFEGVVRFIRGA